MEMFAQFGLVLDHGRVRITWDPGIYVYICDGSSPKLSSRISSPALGLRIVLHIYQMAFMKSLCKTIKPVHAQESWDIRDLGIISIPF